MQRLSPLDQCLAETQLPKHQNTSVRGQCKLLLLVEQCKHRSVPTTTAPLLGNPPLL